MCHDGKARHNGRASGGTAHACFLTAPTDRPAHRPWVHLMAGVDGVSPIAGVSGIDHVQVHAPINDGVDAQFWKDRQSKQRRGGEAEDETHDAPVDEPELEAAIARASISVTDTLSLHPAEPVENPFVSLIEHEMHIHLPTPD